MLNGRGGHLSVTPKTSPCLLWSSGDLLWGATCAPYLTSLRATFAPRHTSLRATFAPRHASLRAAYAPLLTPLRAAYASLLTPLRAGLRDGFRGHLLCLGI